MKKIRLPLAAFVVLALGSASAADAHARGMGRISEQEGFHRHMTSQEHIMSRQHMEAMHGSLAGQDCMDMMDRVRMQDSAHARAHSDDA